FFAGSGGAEFRRLWLDSVYEHARFIHGYFSRHSSANNHLIGEAAGLYIAGLTWPCWPRVRDWRRVAQQILEREALLQSSTDGVSLEQAVCYQQFVLDFLLLALLAGRSADERFSAAYEQRLAAMLVCLASIMDAGGNVPMIGDADDGAVTRLAQSPDFSTYRSLLASGAILFGSGELKAKAGKLDDKTRWLFGSRAGELFRRVEEPRARAPLRRAFPGGGYYILGCDFETRHEIRLVADAGPLGYRSIAAHGHADALAFTLSLGGLEFLIDPGTCAYHGGGEWRAYFRGTAAHNTLRIDGVDQSLPGGDFMWVKQARARCDTWESSDAADVFEAWHDGYLRLSDPVLHRRRITLDKRARRVVIEDRLQMSGAHDVELFLHCDERCTVEAVPAGFAIRRGQWTLVAELPRHRDADARLHRGSLQPLCGWVSRRYDERRPSPTVVWRARLEGDALLRTELMCRSDYPAQS
ncbi:MAG: heparinase, partial [Gammaproteobacteria bacterium]